MTTFRILVALFVCALVALSIEVTAQQVSKSIAQGIASKFMQEHRMGSVDALKHYKFHAVQSMRRKMKLPIMHNWTAAFIKCQIGHTPPLFS